jgi:hypothetical protein
MHACWSTSLCVYLCELLYLCFRGLFYSFSPRFFNAVSRAFFHTPSAFVNAVFADFFHSFASFFILFSGVFQSLCFHRLLVNRCCCIFCIQSISFTTFPFAMVLAEPFVYSISLENSENFKKEIFYQHAWIKLNQNFYGINTLLTTFPSCLCLFLGLAI